MADAARGARASATGRGAGRSRARRSCSPTAARRARACRGRARRAARTPRRSAARPRAPASAGHRARAQRSRGPRRRGRARSPRSRRARPRGCEALSAGSLTTIAGRTPGSEPSAPAARRCTAVISAALSVVGIAATRGRAPGRARGGQRLGGVDDAPAAERDEQLAGVDVVEQLAGELVDAAGRDRVDAAGAVGERRAPSPSARDVVSSDVAARRATPARASSAPRPKWIVRSPSCQVKLAAMRSRASQQASPARAPRGMARAGGRAAALARSASGRRARAAAAAASVRVATRERGLCTDGDRSHDGRRAVREPRPVARRGRAGAAARRARPCGANGSAATLPSCRSSAARATPSTSAMQRGAGQRAAAVEDREVGERADVRVGGVADDDASWLGYMVALLSCARVFDSDQLLTA